ncbi:hypothetical protein WBG78_04835 [Chryseolinea sp. T2]|uniref:hypothetical protein n=1 Tax=Chryseolinea sp. T2 TaxID=3129255 RepID=UPI003076DD96
MKSFPFCRAFVLPFCILLCLASSESFSQAKRAAAKDTVWIYITKVKPGKQADFEKFVHEIFFDKASKLSAKEQRVFKQTRVLHPIKAESDGSYNYCFLMDPTVPGGDYDIESLMKKIYGAAEAEKYLKMYNDAVIRPVI